MYNERVFFYQEHEGGIRTLPRKVWAKNLSIYQIYT